MTFPADRLHLGDFKGSPEPLIFRSEHDQHTQAYPDQHQGRGRITTAFGSSLTGSITGRSVRLSRIIWMSTVDPAESADSLKILFSKHRSPGNSSSKWLVSC